MNTSRGAGSQRRARLRPPVPPLRPDTRGWCVYSEGDTRHRSRAPRSLRGDVTAIRAACRGCSGTIQAGEGASPPEPRTQNLVLPATAVSEAPAPSSPVSVETLQLRGLRRRVRGRSALWGHSQSFPPPPFPLPTPRVRAARPQLSSQGPIGPGGAPAAPTPARLPEASRWAWGGAGGEGPGTVSVREAALPSPLRFPPGGSGY